MVTWELLTALHHLLPADDAHIVTLRKFLLCGIWVQVVHVTDGSARHDHIIERLFERSVAKEEK